MMYRRHNNSDTWHWCTNCEGWPKIRGTYVEQAVPVGRRPSTGQLDDECLAMEKRGTCAPR